MNRIQKLKLNTFTSLFNRVIILLSGLILPRLILIYYGSETNGLISSINSFLSIITFLDLGVSAVVQSALYKPLVQKDGQQMNNVLNTAKIFFRRIAYVLVGYIILLMVFYPLIIDNSLDFVATAFLIFSLSIGQFSQYYFGIINEFLLNADQKSYVQLNTEIITIIINLIFSVILITNGVSIQVVKFTTSFIYLLRPIYLNYYVNKRYPIDKTVEPTEDAIPQKWNGVGQHIAYTIQNSTDVVVLTLFSTLENISIYSVYNMVVQGIKLIVSALTNELKSFFGNILADGEIKLLNNYFTRIEWLIHTGVTLLFGITAVLINPFVRLYTSGVYDVNYDAPLFSILIVIGQLIFSIRTPYQSMIVAAGHFKQTQMSSIIEAVINVIISFLLVGSLGLVGVAIGTICAMLYRTIYLVLYLSKNILYRPTTIFLKHAVVDIITFVLMLFFGGRILGFVPINTFFEWIFVALILGVLFLGLIIAINLIFYKETIISNVKRFLKRN